MGVGYRTVSIRALVRDSPLYYHPSLVPLEKMVTCSAPKRPRCHFYVRLDLLIGKLIMEVCFGPLRVM